jgi:hypothetical protein
LGKSTTCSAASGRDSVSKGPELETGILVLSERGRLHIKAICDIVAKKIGIPLVTFQE